MSARFKFVHLGMAVSVSALMGGCAPETVKGRSADRAPGAADQSAFPPPPAGAAVEPTRLFDNEAGDNSDGGLKKPVVERGTGRLVGEPLSAAAVGVGRGDSGDITLNVVDADIRDVVRLVLEDGLGANYVIDPAVTGSITVRTSRPVPADEVVGMLNSVLNLNGASLIEQDGLYKVIPSGQAAFAGARPGSRASRRTGRPGTGIQVAPLRYADGAQMVELLQPFVADQGAIQLDPARNTLLLVGSADQVATMSDLIDMFDVDWMEGMSFGLYPLDAVGPSQLADELDQIFGDPDIGVSSGSLRFIPIDRLSALLVITAQPDYLDRAEDWIARLDKAGEGEGEQVFVYSVQNGRAVDLASVLGELFDIQSTAVGEPSLLAPGLDPVSLGSSFDGDDGGGSLLEQTAAGDEGLGASPRRPGRARGPRNEGFDPRELTPGRTEIGTRIVADETSNSLLIRASAKEYKKILGALQKLDKQPLQVLLEATIAEVTLKDELSYGVQWFFGSDESNVAFSEFTNRSVGEIFPTGFTGLLARGDVRVAIDALDTVSDVNVISSPQILVLDNQTAQLEVGDEVPIITKTAEGFDENSLSVNTVEQRQTGVILNVTPRVNASGLVVLDIQQEVSDVVRTTTSGIDSPTIAQRRIGTSVAVGTDQTVVLGGLIQDDVEDIQSGIPLLKDIPGLGVLFGNTTQITSRTELLVMITPKVLTNQQEAVEATNELRRRLRKLEPLREKIVSPSLLREERLEPEASITSEPPSAEAPARIPASRQALKTPKTSERPRNLFPFEDGALAAPATSLQAAQSPEGPKRLTASQSQTANVRVEVQDMLASSVGAMMTEARAAPADHDGAADNFVVHLISVPEETDAWNLWMAYQKDHAEAFQGLTPEIVMVETSAENGEDRAYRLRLGPFAGEEQAAHLCFALEQTSDDCLVVREKS